MIDGQGADELLAGYQYYFAIRQNDLMNTGQWGQLAWNRWVQSRRLKLAAAKYSDPARRFSAEAGLVHAHDGEGRHLTDDTLGELEARTAGSFVRVSRSDLVAIEAVERITSNPDGGATLVLSDGESVRVSRRRTSDVRRALGG